MKKSPSRRKKRILVDVPYEKYIEEGLIRVKNASGCWKTNNGIDIIAKKVSDKYSCGFPNPLISSIIVGERYLD